MRILAAPIQEYTDAAFRNAHAKIIGGIDEYYTPFLRLEHGVLTKRAAADIAPENNRADNIVPQLLVKNAEETRVLLRILADHGYHRADINFGCPFPKVVKSDYGAGMLERHDAIRDVLEEACAHTEFRISVKMRLGVKDTQTAQALLPLLNNAPLDKIVLHPRTAEQQYDGIPDRNAFSIFQKECHHPLFYNGDIRTTDDAVGLDNIMIGRGLLANPLLSLQLRGMQASNTLLADFHSAYVEECCRLFQQPLQKLKLFWNFFLPQADKRLRKAIAKSTTMQEYLYNSQCSILNSQL